MAGWGRFVAGAVIGVAGTIYATNEEVRKRLPEAARNLPDDVRRRFRGAVSAAKQASSERRAEILRELKEHDAAERAVPSGVSAGVPPGPPTGPPPRADGVVPPAAVPEDEDATRPIPRTGQE